MRVRVPVPVPNFERKMTRETHLPENWKKTPDANGWIPNVSVPVRIVCAANKSPCGLIFCGSRHFSNAMYAQIVAAGIDTHSTEQGFIDQYDRFWTREQAYEIMVIEGQEMRYDAVVIPGCLFSENLY